MADDIISVTVPLNAISPGSGGTVRVWTAPTVAGGFTAVAAVASNNATTSGTVSWTVGLLRYGTAAAAGTPAVNGTVAAAQGGTADHWVTGVPKTLTLGSDRFISAGEHLYVAYVPQNAGTPTAGVLTIHLAQGRGAY